MKKKYIVFDLDETLGTFPQLSILCDTIEDTFKVTLTQKAFNELCDTYIHLFRPNLLIILRTIIKYKQHNPNIKVVIYTNNNGPKSWTMKIKTYIEMKLRYKIFDHIICGYKDYYGNRVEMCRTSFNKLPQDLIRCVNGDNNSEYLFFDDQSHSNMIHKNITYIRSKPYNYYYLPDDVINKFLTTNVSRFLIRSNNSLMLFRNKYASYRYTTNIPRRDEINIDIAITKQMISHINKFLRI